MRAELRVNQKTDQKTNEWDKALEETQALGEAIGQGDLDAMVSLEAQRQVTLGRLLSRRSNENFSDFTSAEQAKLQVFLDLNQTLELQVTKMCAPLRRELLQFEQGRRAQAFYSSH